MRRHELAMRLVAWVSTAIAGGLVGFLAGETLVQLGHLGSEEMVTWRVAAAAGGCWVCSTRDSSKLANCPPKRCSDGRAPGSQYGC
jgi:hypothetical protein